MRDGDALKIPGPESLRRRLIGKLESSEVGLLLAEYGLITDK
jgi:oleate hydratase